MLRSRVSHRLSALLPYDLAPLLSVRLEGPSEAPRAAGSYLYSGGHSEWPSEPLLGYSGAVVL